MKSHFFSQNKKYSIKYFKLYIALFYLLGSFNTAPISAQNHKGNTYPSEMDSVWSRSTYIKGMTTDGNWVWFTESFDHKDDVLHLTHTSDSTEFLLPASEWLRFSNDNHWFGCITSKNELHLIDLKNRTKEVFQNIKSYGFSDSSDFLAAKQKDKGTNGTLLVKNLKNKKTTILENVSMFLWHPEKNILLTNIYEDNKNKIIAYDFMKSNQSVINESKKSNFKHLLWSKSGNALVFLEQLNNENTDNYIHYYHLDGNSKTLSDTILDEAFSLYKISVKELFIADNGKTVFFYKETNSIPSKEKHTFEEWDTKDPWIYPKMKDYEERELKYRLTAWYPETNKLTAIETEELPTAALDVNHTHALVFNKLIYEPQYKEYPDTDIYIKHIQSGNNSLVVKGQYSEPGFVTISPNGKYITYFKNKHWWAYNIENSKTVNLTQNIHVPFENIESDRAGDTPPFGNPGWSTNDEYIILYDQYDIWLITPDGRYKDRISNGREEKIKYRISKEFQRNNYYFLTTHIDFSCSPYNLDRGVILELFDSNRTSTGYVFWNRNNLKKIAYEHRKIDEILISEDYGKVVFRKQKFNESPSIHFMNLTNTDHKILYQSNIGLKKYDLGNAKLINYVTKTGDSLQGSLIYPANFDPKKKYPMIVYIYEKISGRINIFNPPSDDELDGFNTLRYTTNDYFVLYPNISYTIQNPGISALYCVTAAVNKALGTGVIDKNKLGLIGHSFGGYETAFIVTQTNMFAAAVAGASVTDFVSHYHNVGWNSNTPDIWRYESQQWRMGNSFYNIKDAYYNNSPIHHIESLQTPLLLWTGKVDYQVNWTQSIEFYLGMRRLGKIGKLLLYNKERHSITNPVNQKHLSNSILNWFDRFCK